MRTFVKYKGLTGDKNQCPGCGELFNSTYAFDKHRVGEYGTATNRQANRRCLTPEEMSAKGMLKNARGFWITEASTRWEGDGDK